VQFIRSLVCLRKYDSSSPQGKSPFYFNPDVVMVSVSVFHLLFVKDAGVCVCVCVCVCVWMDADEGLESFIVCVGRLEGKSKGKSKSKSKRWWGFIYIWYLVFGIWYLCLIFVFGIFFETPRRQTGWVCGIFVVLVGRWLRLRHIFSHHHHQRQKCQLRIRSSNHPTNHAPKLPCPGL